MNKLRGRMLYLPPKNKKKKDILLIYDRLGRIEEFSGLAQSLNRFGAVTIPDLPGFGGMESFYKIKEKPSINRLADYLASFIKLRYKRKQLTIVGVGFGLVIATRMIQKYPDLAKKIDLVVSINGFAHNDDFRMNRFKKYSYTLIGWIGSQRLPAPSLQYMGLRSIILHWYFFNSPRVSEAMVKMTENEKKKFLKQQIALWQSINLRTHLATLSACMRLDNCKDRVSVNIWHIYTESDNNLDQNYVEQHLKIIFKKYHQNKVSLRLSYLSGLDSRTASKLFPEKLRRELLK